MLESQLAESVLEPVELESQLAVQVVSESQPVVLVLPLEASESLSDLEWASA